MDEAQLDPTAEDPDVEDFEIRSSPETEPPLPMAEEPDERAGRGALVAVALLLLVALGGGGAFLYWVFFGGAPQSAVDAEPAAPESALTLPTPMESATAEAPKAEPVVLPKLDASDEAVRTLAMTLSRHPRFASWLATDELVRRFVRVVANVAYGESPRNHVRFLEPDGKFVVQRSGEDLRVDPQSYARYDLVTEVFVSLDDEGLGELYAFLAPLLEEAYRELGYPDPSFGQLLRRSVDEMLEVPLVEPDLLVRPRVISYELADPALEGLSDPQKQLLRMGPTNVRRIQEKLGRLVRQLDLS